MKYYITESQIKNICEVLISIKELLDSFITEFNKLKMEQEVY